MNIAADGIGLISQLAKAMAIPSMCLDIECMLNSMFIGTLGLGMSLSETRGYKFNSINFIQCTS